MEKIESRKYLIINEVFNSITHGIGWGLAIAGLVLLLVKASGSGSAMQVVSASIYGAALILLFLFSTLAHSLHFTKAVKVFRVFDHSGIYFLIAGTYTPYCLVAVKGWLGWTIFGVIWACAIVGISLTAIYLPRWNSVPKSSTLLYILMGWMILLAIYPLWNTITPLQFWLLVAGGVTYSLGALFYHYKFPYAHVIWHIFVLIAAILMWFSVYGFMG